MKSITDRIKVTVAPDPDKDRTIVKATLAIVQDCYVDTHHLRDHQKMVARAKEHSPRMVRECLLGKNIDADVNHLEGVIQQLAATNPTAYADHLHTEATNIINNIKAQLA